MKITTPDKYFCDICNCERPELELRAYRLYRGSVCRKDFREMVGEIDVCCNCEPSDSFFNCEKKKTLFKKIMYKFIKPKI